MKFALIIPDGVADEPQPSLGGKTPLQAARIPHMDDIARRGVVGRANNVPESLPSGSDVGTMSLFGYDPLIYHTGRAPLEAAAQGLSLGPDDWAIRCNFVTINNNRMHSFTAGQIPNEISQNLIEALQHSACGDAHWKYFAGVSYRNLLIYRGRGEPSPFAADTNTTPPHDITAQIIDPYLPHGTGSELLRDLMTKSRDVLAGVEANRTRGDSAATQTWLWGLGKSPVLKPFRERFGVCGAVITAVDLLRGIGRLLGWQVIEVPGATGYLDTDYAAKGRYAVAALQRPDIDFIVVHVEATDEASHEGHADEKVKALERIDAEIVAPVHDYLHSQGDYRILISPDHPTFLRTKTHSHGYVPVAMCGSDIPSAGMPSYDEAIGIRSHLCFEKGCDLMPAFMSRT
ncbi:MAG: cofactor-independent phosphoglycerate mutase [Planctomycetes bacterium]|nr:cofactor-independent phosphoglycerate mutase [Planctomycetota bacterium]